MRFRRQTGTRTPSRGCKPPQGNGLGPKIIFVQRIDCYQQLTHGRYNVPIVIGQTISRYKITEKLGDVIVDELAAQRHMEVSRLSCSSLRTGSAGLLAILSPSRLEPSIGRNLRFASARRIRLDVDFATTGLIGSVSHPSNVRRELPHHLPKLWSKVGDRSRIGSKDPGAISG